MRTILVNNLTSEVVMSKNNIFFEACERQYNVFVKASKDCLKTEYTSHALHKAEHYMLIAEEFKRLSEDMDYLEYYTTHKFNTYKFAWLYAHGVTLSEILEYRNSHGVSLSVLVAETESKRMEIFYEKMCDGIIEIPEEISSEVEMYPFPLK